MEFDKKLYGLFVIVYGLTYLWPYMIQVWVAYREGRPVGQVPRPRASKLIAAGLAFLIGVLWIWQHSRH